MPPAAVPIAPVGPVATATMIFRENGVVSVAAIVKATFSLDGRAPMSIAQPEPIFAREVHRMNNPTRSITATSDLVPRLPGADVLLLGQAHAPGGSATHVVVRLVVGRGDTPLLDKALHVVGDRRGDEIKPFRSIPLVYEKAFGGPGYRDNPLGTGALSGDPPPNLLAPHGADEGAVMAGFGPISRSWPARASLVTAEVRAGLDRPFAEIPPGFDFRYFHAAPPDQRLAHLVGDEWVVLENVHPQRPTLHVHLPGAQAMVRVLDPKSDAPRVFSLRADTLRIDTEAERCTIVWRNSFRVDEANLDALRMFAGVSLPGAPIAWPEPSLPHDVRQSVPLGVTTPAQGAGGTIVLADEDVASPTFGSTMEVSDEDIESVHIDGPVPDLSSTALLSSTAVPPTAPLPAFMPPLAPARPAERPALAPERRPDPKGGTLDLSREFASMGRAVMPFAGAGPARPEGPRAAAPIPGSPWDPGRAHALPSEEAPTFDLGSTDLSSTFASPGSFSPAAPPPVAAPPARPEPPSIFSHESPDSAKTHIRELPPLPSDARPLPPAQAAPVEPPRQAPPTDTADPWGRALHDAAPMSARDETAGEPPSGGPVTPTSARPAPPPKGLREALYKRFKKG